MGIVEEIKRLKAMLDHGTINQEEFNILKNKVMSEERFPGKSSLHELSVKQVSSKLIDLLMNLIFITGITLGLVFYMRYNSVLAILVTWVIAITIPFVIFFFLQTRFPKWIELSIVLLLYIFLIIVPIKKSRSHSELSYTEIKQSSSSNTEIKMKFSS